MTTSYREMQKNKTLNEYFTDNVSVVLEACKNLNKPFTYDDVEEELQKQEYNFDIKESSVERYVRKLHKKGVIVRMKRGVYHVVQD